MKVFLLLFLCLGPAFLVMLRAQTVHIDVEKASLYDVLEDIRKQTQFDLIGSMALLNGAEPVTLHVRNKELSSVLHTLSLGQPLYLYLEDKTIIVQKKAEQQVRLEREKLRTLEVVKKPYNLRGHVRDEAGLPIEGVTVQVGTMRTQTDIDGSFVLAVDRGNDILFSRLGYSRKRLNAGGRVDLDVVLTAEHLLMEEVLVNTGYTQRPQLAMTGASTVITRQDLESFQTNDIFSVLQALDPAWQIGSRLQFGSNPNVLPEITVRGINNIGDYFRRDPLIILDGVEVPIERLYDLDINRIERISLLKDASSTVLYGSRGGNGVLVVETRLPQLGKPRISYQLQPIVTMPDLSDYHLMNAEQKLDYEKSIGLYDAENYTIDPAFIAELQTLLDGEYTGKRTNLLRGVNTDWLAQPVQNSLSLGHSLRLEGGSQQIRYAVEGNYLDLQGAMKGSGRERKSLTFTGQYRPSHRLNINLRSTSQAVKAYQSPYGSFSTYAKMNPYQPLYGDDGELLREYSNESLFGIVFNPLYNASLTHRNERRESVFSHNLQLTWYIRPHLILKSTNLLEYSVQTDEQYTSPFHTQFDDLEVGQRGQFFNVQGHDLVYNSNLNLGYNKTCGKHSFGTHLVGELRALRFRQEVRALQGFPENGEATLDSLSVLLKKEPLSNSERSDRLSSMLFIGNYQYDSRWMAEFSYRVDGASKFGRNDRYGNFWNAGLAYNLQDAGFLKNTPLQRLRVFVNTGVNGTEAFDQNMNRTAYTLSPGASYYNEDALVYAAEGNPNLRWPHIRSWSTGLQASLWDDRLSFYVNYYHKTTDRMISLVTTAPSVGLQGNSYFENMGKVLNRGFESMVTLKLMENKSRATRWLLQLSADRNRGKLLEISEALQELNESNLRKDATGQYVQNVYYQEGESIDNIKGVRSLGIDPASGKEIFLDRNGRVTDTWDPADIQVVGNREPDLFGNISSSFNWRGLGIQAFFYYTLGGDIYNQTLVERIENNDGVENTDRRANEERWQQPGDVSLFKDRKNTELTRLSSRFVQKENTLRFSSLVLHYDLPSAFIERYKLQRCRINFALNDIYRWSTVKMERGLDYPFARAFNFGLMVQF